jgi:hypothetical protein
MVSTHLTYISEHFSRARKTAVNIVDGILTAIKKLSCPLPVFNLKLVQFVRHFKKQNPADKWQY